MKISTHGRNIAKHIAQRDYLGAVAAIDTALAGESGPAWIRDFGKLRAFLIATQAGENPDTPFTIIKADGNSKLPFAAFSSLPGVGFCHGAGDCLSFCYSFRAWRYPAAFCRQAMNAVLMQTETGRARILAALDRFKRFGKRIDFRLYVDGDFTSVQDVAFWFDALMARPWLAAYGYSKAWAELSAYSGAYPENYLLNLSSGSVHGAEMRARMEALPITRGVFDAVNVGYNVRNDMHNDRAHKKNLREAYGRKAFTCPGKCGECTPKGHACGSARFAGVPIIIAVH